MSKYLRRDGRFVITDYAKGKTFSSFLPAVAGVDGKPIWAFYASVGQCMGGFGITSKETPITPFDSANLAYGNIPIKGFRTFMKIDEKFYEPFADKNRTTEMSIGLADLQIREIGEKVETTILYSSLSHRDYGALIRKVTIKNTSKKPLALEVADGLPVYFPHGLSNICYKELVSLMAAYCEVHGLSSRTPFVKFKTSTGDNSLVKEAEDGNGFFSVDENGYFLRDIVDPYLIFRDDLTNIIPEGFLSKKLSSLMNESQQKENKLPCAFSLCKKTLGPNETYSFYSLYGMWDTYEEYTSTAKKMTPNEFEKAIKETSLLVDEILKPASCKCEYPLFEEGLRQSYLDNNLRGGFPTKIGTETYYVYGRKHGDMERDYNAFQIPAAYYSSGPGNFRDVNQNRRNDLFFAPYVEDYNINIFFNLIQVDGQNPLTVKPNSFSFEVEKLPYELREDKEIIAIKDHFAPGTLYGLLRKKYSKDKATRLFEEIISHSSQNIEAAFGEGYWIDHWTYNVDLLESYSSVYPDKEESLFFDKEYRYFYSPVYVEPRDEKYSLRDDGEVRQYGAIDLKAVKEYCEKTGFDITKTAWLKYADGSEVKVSLASKIVALCLIKFSTLDSEQMGIEMECEKPGWNDAMNGLPGLFASAMSETVELLRLVRYAYKHLSAFPTHKITLLEKQYEMFIGLKKYLEELHNGELTSFEYWDKVTSLRESLRAEYRYNAGEICNKEVEIAEILPLLKQMDETLSKGLIKAKEAGKCILPSYLIYRVKSYEKLGRKNFLGYETIKVTSFELETIPPFLEASARALKLGDGTISKEDYLRIKGSDLYDHKLHFYKTCAAIDDAPFEIGRVHAFTKGWLERECNFLHMDYKYLLGLLEAHYYDEFYDEIKTNWVINMDPNVYGRNPAEASSFIVPSCNPDSSKHGRGFFARLTGANAEFLDMYVRLFAGEELFSYRNGELYFHLAPSLSKEFFGEKGEVSFLLFGQTEINYHNKKALDCYKGVKLTYEINGEKMDEVKGDYARQIREGKIKKVEVYIDEDAQ